MEREWDAVNRFHTILFDADGTLLDFHRSEREALADCLSARGLPCDSDLIELYSCINDEHWKMLERGEITRVQLYVRRFAAFFDACGFSSDPTTMHDDYIRALSTKSYLIDGAYELCARLRETCRLYLITNGNTKVQHGRFDPSPLQPLFEKSFISEEIGYDKPSAEYFNFVKAAIPQFDPADTLVVGDSLTSDIGGGIAAGLATCWYNPKGKPVPDGMKIDFVVEDFDGVLRAVTEGV